MHTTTALCDDEFSAQKYFEDLMMIFFVVGQKQFN